MSVSSSDGGSGPVGVRRGGRWWRRVALVLFAVGVVLLGYVGWQFFGTTYVAQKRHDEIVKKLEDEWSRPGGGDKVGTGWGEASAIVRIPKFGSDYAVPVLEGATDDVFAVGFGRFTDLAEAGGKGNYAIGGHRVTHGEPLRRMGELEPGDEVVVETRRATYVYSLTTGGDDIRVRFSEGWALTDRPVNPDSSGPAAPHAKRMLTLVTCAALFHTDFRWVAFGELVSVTRR